jgi:cobaltochelatase CobT
VSSNQTRPNAPHEDHEPIKRDIAITLRALAGSNDIDVQFAQAKPALLGREVRLPDLPKALKAHDVTLLRGHADALAFKIACHDRVLHQKNAPQDEAGRLIFDMAEDVRVQALGMRRLEGVARNISAVISDQSSKLPFASSQDKVDVPVDVALKLHLLQVLSGQDLSPTSHALAHVWHEEFEQKAGTLFPQLSAFMEDQALYGQIVYRLLEALELGAGSYAQPSEQPDDQAGDKATQDEPQAGDGAQDGEQLEVDQAEGAEQSPESMFAAVDAPDGADGRTEYDLADSGDVPESQGARSPDARSILEKLPYKAFTTRFDEIVGAEELCTADELDRLRSYLDRQLEALQGVVARLANRLQRRLLARQLRTWEFDLEEGMLDSARLTRLVVDPFQPLSFKREKDTDFRDTIVTLLIDNSGSMRGRPISIAATCADILARTLERCGVKVEILGFTTRAWKGGQARENWLQAGKPALPGRLNDLRHIVYKSADTPWRRARRNLGLMMREGLLKENVDGEALLWAKDRLVARGEDRRILMMISDGAPVDDSTLSTNPGTYLEQHLRAVIEEIESRTPIELVAIGIGHDVTRYYKRAVTIVDAEQLGGVMVDELVSLFESQIS